MRAVAGHRQKVHVVGVVIGQVRNRTERRLAGLVGAEQQRYRAIAEQHRLNHQSRFDALLLEGNVVNLIALAHPRDLAKTVVRIAEQWRDKRSVCFGHQHDGHLSGVSGQIPLRDFDRLQHYRATLRLHADRAQRARQQTVRPRHDFRSEAGKHLVRGIGGRN